MNELLQYKSDYLIPGVAGTHGPGFHRVTLSWSPVRRRDTLHLDPNACGLDRFGDPTVCTLMAMAPYDMKLALLQEESGKRLYAIEAHHDGPDHKKLNTPAEWTWVDAGRSSQWCRPDA